MTANLLCVLFIAVVRSQDPWFEAKYPRQEVVHRVSPGSTVVIDGNLDDAAWAAVPWSADGFVDIAAVVYPDLSPPPHFQTRFKLLWDPDYLYVGANVSDPLVWGSITGHNDGLTAHKAPWWNPDFEFFVDVSGSTHYYKEFEMNVRNATYDVLWRVPDAGMQSRGVPCNATWSLWCQNSTFNPGQTWTMYPGLRTAVSAPQFYTPYGAPYWVVEARFPIKSTAQHGGLLDGEGSNDLRRYDPSTMLASGLTPFWWANFARTQHPLMPVGPHPLGTDFQDSGYTSQCPSVQRAFPNLLGTGPYSCYWEYAWAPAGHTRYMHNPDMWGLLQFSPESSGAVLCKTPHWPARHVAVLVYRAQVQRSIIAGSYATNLSDLLSPQYCSDEADCSLDDLRYVSQNIPQQYNVNISVWNNGSCVNYAMSVPTGGACFFVNVTTSLGYSASIETSRRLSYYPDVKAGSCLPGGGGPPPAGAEE